MAPSRNQPQFDFLTGSSPPSNAQSFRATLRASQAIVPDVGNEELRKQLHKLQYEINSLKQERGVEELRHKDELRAVQIKAEADFKRAQASESSNRTAATRHDVLTSELHELRELSSKQRTELERKLRASQEQNAVLQEAVEEAQAELSSDLRQAKHDLSELHAKYDILEKQWEALQSDRDEKNVALQVTQQRLSQQEAHIGSLENDVLRLKAQTNDVDTLEVIKRELSEQVAHIKRLEAVNKEQRIELKKFRNKQESIEVVEEEKRMLEGKVRMMDDLRKELVEAQLQKQILEDERKAWSRYLENGAIDEKTRFESPGDLAKAYIQERLEKITLLDQLGRVSPELSAKDEIIKGLEEDKNKLRDEADKLRATVSGVDSKARTRLERQRTLAVKEVEYLRAQLRTFDTEESEIQPERYDEQKTKRIKELEELVDQYRKEVEILNSDVAKTDKHNASATSPTQNTKRPRDEVEDERLGELLRKNRALQDSLAKIKTSKALFEKELDVCKSQLASMKETTRTRVLELRSNPTADAEALKLSTLRTLRAENTALLAQLEASAGTPTAPTHLKTVPIATLERLRADMAEKDSALASKEKHISRLKQIWSAKSLEFREAVASILGWKLDFMPNGRVRVTSMFYAGTDAEEGDEGGNSIVFDGEDGTMKVSGGPKSAFAGEIRGLIEFWVEGRQEIPCFLAAATLEFYEKSTRAQRM